MDVNKTRILSKIIRRNLLCQIKKVEDITKEYDKNGNLIHSKDSDVFEYWREYDDNGNLIHYKDSNGVEYWKEYDKNGNLIHYKDSNGVEIYY